MIHFPRLFVRFGQFKVPVALLCSVRSVVLLLMTCPRVTCPCFVIALLQHVFRCTDFPPDSCHASLCFKQCSFYSLYSTNHFSPLFATPLLSTTNCVCLAWAKIMFTLVLSAKSINAIDLKALLSFCCFFSYFLPILLFLLLLLCCVAVVIY